MEMLRGLFLRVFGFDGEEFDPDSIPSVKPVSEPLTVGKGGKSLKVIVLSDTHMQFPKDIPDGDVLIHCGDFINAIGSSEKDIHDFNEWLGLQMHKEKIIICGNHEVPLKDKKIEYIQKIFTNATYLQGTTHQLECGLTVFGSPYTHSRSIIYRANAFSVDRSTIDKEFSKIPDNVDIVVTHVPSLGILDKTHVDSHVGSSSLLNNILKTKPLLHVCGHNHDQTGAVWLNETLVVNAAQAGSYHGPFEITIQYN